MKKIIVNSIVLVLLNTQIYGCFNHIEEVNETVVLPAWESNLQESETMLINEHDPETDYPTETMDASEPNMNALIKETEADPDRYRAATNLSCTDVEDYAAEIKRMFLEHDWRAIASELSYPVVISGVTYNSSADFLGASSRFTLNLDKAFFSALEKEDCTAMFCSAEGIMLGETGQIWINEVLDEELNSQGLKITAVNGMLKE